MRSIQVGDIEVQALTDGRLRFPASFFPGLEPGNSPGVIAADGSVSVATGAFLIRGHGRTILVDAGFGPRPLGSPQDLPHAEDTGGLPAALEAAGCAPGDVDTLLLSDLHARHVGWVAPHGKPFFPNAEVLHGESGWEALITPAGRHEWARVALEAIRREGRLRGLNGIEEIAPGVTARPAPGHTPGQYVLEVVDQEHRAVLLGGVFQLPAQLADPGIGFLADRDADQAAHTRRRWLDDLAGTDTIAAAGHFPDEPFFRITTHHTVEPVSALPAA
ncbi:MBL fold metallo-hydrolase [Amycolatopsis jiangsuensis]|uniref:Glyoxylase-like metal-dependent hydrolase (Beta-lactamase superfamily II) n=1 Tax=Amycolatopsis jiangsuensis TaxID=1181879 RepID=A0A840J405_9PSEU|nr:MBL fold metallo-hydrolase [Amycolatopsis jiangsuensis]MBB4688167.1 glyoxylase-like metal-dependent hydrolase (beta-lactamase superfamily II) [Amycolatopsis jiangsuensis]